jgi:hypothetical protein
MKVHPPAFRPYPGRSPFQSPNSEREISAALGFGDSEDIETIMRKLPPDACKPYVYLNFLDLLKNPATRKTLVDAENLSYPALLLLQNPYLANNLTGTFISEFAETYATQLDIVCCPWGPLLRGSGKGDDFTWTFQMALDVVLADPNAVIISMDDLRVKNCLLGLAYDR